MSKNWEKEAEKQFAALKETAPDYSDAWDDLYRKTRDTE